MNNNEWKNDCQKKMNQYYHRLEWNSRFTNVLSVLPVIGVSYLSVRKKKISLPNFCFFGGVSFCTIQNEKQKNKNIRNYSNYKSLHDRIYSSSVFIRGNNKDLFNEYEEIKEDEKNLK